MKEIKLRDYQKSDIERIESAWTEYPSILYQLPTGGGKSVIISKLISDHKDERIIVFAHKRRLLTQLKQHLSNVGVKTGLLIASTEENMDSNVVIVSIRTAVKDARLDKLLLQNWDRIVIDEARNSRTNSYDKVIDAIKANNLNIRVFGTDATPYRKDKKRLDKHFDYMVCSTETTASLIKKGFLAEYKTYVAPIGEIEKEVTEVANDYQQQQLSDYMRQPQYLAYVVDMYKRYGDNRQAIVFAVDKEHARSLKKTFVEHKVNGVEQIDSSLSVDEVEGIVKSYEEKKTQILINVEMLTEGVDLPDTGVIVGARPTKSLTLYLQMVGRGTRLKSDGSNLIVLDCCGWTKAFGQLSSPKHWSLNPEIDPNNPRLNNRVVGKRKDGTYEEDLSDWIGEVIEMTPEEYLNSVQNGLEKATDINLSIDDKILLLYEEIVKVFKTQLKNKFNGYDYKIEQSSHDNYIQFTDINNKETSSWNKIRVNVYFGKKGRLHAEMNGGYYERTEDEFMKMSRLFGRINEIFFEVPKIEIQCLELYEQIVDLEKSKINLEAFKEATKVFIEEQWKKKIDDWCVSNDGLFELNDKVMKNSFFKGYSNDRICSIKVSGGKVTSYSNTIEIGCLDRWSREEKAYIEEKKYIKGEKIYDILKSGRWGEEIIQK